MSLVVFAGPSLPRASRDLVPEAEWRPPAEAGDILRLELRPGLTICLIDGYFDHRPAARHKELLLALAAGVRVIGAASIGALRAAEMDAFGMEGVGAIYRAYARGAISGDDEVALIHAGAERGWTPLSVPLVEVRATLCRLVRQRQLPAAEARATMLRARRIHYAGRDWPSMAAEPLRTLLQSEHVRLKTLDATAALAVAQTQTRLVRARPQPVITSFVRALAREAGAELPPRTPDPASR